MRGMRRIGVFLPAAVVMLAASASPATATLTGPQAAAAAEPTAETGVINASTDGLAAGTNQAGGERRARPTRPLGVALAPAALTPIGATTAGPSSHLLANFDGVSSLDSGLTNFGAEFEPPDQGLCAGNGFVVEM
ncbi:MAG: hypothetical protein M3003_16700, partial [Candidatus Dormibacteraeota bacterium]|nr:hypothetical protein [Candidatus Dormibacteraeota bacterium]